MPRNQTSTGSYDVLGRSGNLGSITVITNESGAVERDSDCGRHSHRAAI